MKLKFSSVIIILLAVSISCKKSEEAPIVYQSTLSTTDPNWFSGSSTGYSCGFNQGKYEISITLPYYYAYALAPVSNINYPYSVSVNATIQLSDTTRYGFCGFYFNFVDTKNYTALIISSTGSFGIVENAKGNYSMPVPFAQTNAIKKGSGKVNAIQLSQHATTVDVLINNTLINTFPITLTPNAGVGVFAQASGGTDFTSMAGAFNNIVMKKL